MSVHLVGGGLATVQPIRVYGGFVAEAVAHARQDGRFKPKIGVVQLHEGDAEEGAELYGRFGQMLTGLSPCEPVPFLVDEGDTMATGQLTGLDGLLVSGGLTPAYLRAVLPLKDEIQTLVGAGVPYLGFSAGAAIAAERAIVGGWKIGDLTVTHEDNGEELDELTLADGLGLVDFGVDVHAVQWGNLSRAVMAVATGGLERALALDESTVCIVDGAARRVHGIGQAWWLERLADGVAVRLQRDELHD